MSSLKKKLALKTNPCFRTLAGSRLPHLKLQLLHVQLQLQALVLYYRRKPRVRARVPGSTATVRKSLSLARMSSNQGWILKIKSCCLCLYFEYESNLVMLRKLIIKIFLYRLIFVKYKNSQK